MQIPPSKANDPYYIQINIPLINIPAAKYDSGAYFLRGRINLFTILTVKR